MSDDRQPTYDGGIAAVLDQMEARRDPLTYGKGEALPPLDTDLQPLKTARVGPIAADPEIFYAETTYAKKRKHLRKEFHDEPELCCLNGLLIANLRRRSAPPEAAPLFLRLWREEGAFLLEHLNLRWQVSSLTTFADHGETEPQRRVGHTLSVLLNTMKLYESERRYSRYDADTPFTLRNRSRAPLPLEMDAFSIEHGGLDVNMIGRIWCDAELDPVIQPLAHHLIDALIHDPGTVFRRLRRMRHRKLKRKARDAADKAAE